MGCATSKLDNEDTVWRCKERRRLIKEAVYARNYLSAAHSDYCRSLRVTGAALLAFASGEPLTVSHHAPAVFLRGDSPPHIPYVPPSPSIRHPPPPSVMSSHRPAPPPIRRNKHMKLPHILSDTSSPPPSHKFTYKARANSTYSSTPSQGSSIWHWDNFYPPPSPPDSEYFQHLQNSKNPKPPNHDQVDYAVNGNNETAPSLRSYSNTHHSAASHHFDDRSSNFSTYSKRNVQKDGQNPDRWESEEETEREEVQCSEWGDRYSTTSSSNDEDLKSRSDFGRRSDYGLGENEPPAKANTDSKYSSRLEKISSEEDGKSSVSWGDGNRESLNPDRRIVVRHKDLAEIAAAIKEYFDKAASAGEQVSEILETGRAQFDRSFKQLKKTVYHSSGMLSKLTSSWTSKPPLAVRYQFDFVALEQQGGTRSLCSTMERLLAWEKKLYEEVKAREGVKIEQEKKLSSLQSQEYRGECDTKLDKTKATIKRLQSLIAVTSQAVSTTSAAILGLRDSDLIPQLVELCHGFMYMWRAMNQFHEAQNDIVQQVRGLVTQMNRGDCTSDLHKQATCYLESAVSEWHSSFFRLIKFQRDFIRALNGWFKLTLLPVNNEPDHPRRELGKVAGFMDEWNLAIDRVPDTVASEAIKSFINVVHSISLKQTEELKIKKRTETVSKELEKKASSLRNIEKKYYLSYSTVGIRLPDSRPDSGHILDSRDPLSEKKAELAIFQGRVEDEMLRHSKAVEVTRAMTLNNLQTGLPGVFQAMTGFSALITEALEGVCTSSYSI